MAKVTLSVRDMPEVLSALRESLARILREEAGAESDLRTARRLREIAAEFEVGLKG